MTPTTLVSALLRNKQVAALLMAAVAVLIAGAVAEAATTISTNLDTDGTLDVAGNSILASADIGGGYTAGSGSGATLSTAGALSINGNFNVNGQATTTAASGNFATEGSVLIGGGTAITGHLSNTASLDFPIIAANSCNAQTVTVTGAATGDVVSLGMPHTAIANASSTLTWSGWVSAADTVSVRLCQVAATATSDFAAGTVRADVWQH